MVGLRGQKPFRGVCLCPPIFYGQRDGTRSLSDFEQASLPIDIGDLQVLFNCVHKGEVRQWPRVCPPKTFSLCCLLGKLISGKEALFLKVSVMPRSSGALPPLCMETLT